MTPERELTRFAAAELLRSTHPQLAKKVMKVQIARSPEPILLLRSSNFVGWIRIVGSEAVLRYGNMLTGTVSKRVRMNTLNQKGGRKMVKAISTAIHEVQADGSTVAPPIHEALQFIRTHDSKLKPKLPIEAHKNPPSISTHQITKPDPPQAVDRRMHGLERHPAAYGFTEENLDDVRLVTVNPAAIPAVIGAFFMFLALVGGPYEMYVAVRFVVTAMAIWTAVVAGGLKKTAWTMVFVLTAILFNPLIPVHATREFWAPIDLAGVVIFIVAGMKLLASKPANAVNSA